MNQPSSVNASAVASIPVAGEDVRAAHLDLAGLAVRNGLARRHVHDARLLSGKRHADGSRAPLAVVGIGQVHDRLGHAVAFEDRLSEKAGELLEELQTERGGAGDVEPQTPGGRSLTLGLRDQPAVHRWHSEEHRDVLIFLEDVQNFSRLESPQQAHTRAGVERAVHADHQPMRVEKGQRQQQAIRLRPAPRGCHRLDVRDEIAMQQQRALGAARRAGGVGEDSRRVLVG